MKIIFNSFIYIYFQMLVANASPVGPLFFPKVEMVQLDLREKSAEKKEHPLRRAEIIFFIALPFTILYSNLVDVLLAGASDLSNLIKNAKSTLTIVSLEKFAYPSETLKSDQVFIWVNSILWGLSISINDYIENSRTGKPPRLERPTARAFLSVDFVRMTF